MQNKFKAIIKEDQPTRTSSLTFSNESSLYNYMHMQGGVRKTEQMKKTEWTDEKHSMYIKSIEASFVNQLYDAKHIIGTSHDPATTSGQFKVLRHGHWQKMNFERDNNNPKQMMSRNKNKNNKLKSNQWVQHYRTPTKQRIISSNNDVAVPSLQESVTSTIRIVDLSQRKGVSFVPRQVHGSHVCHQDMLSSDTEMSDQNFVDEEEVQGEKETKRNKVKRNKSLMINAKANDQMVPTKSSPIEDVTKNCFPAG